MPNLSAQDNKEILTRISKLAGARQEILPSPSGRGGAKGTTTYVILSDSEESQVKDTKAVRH